MVLFLSACRVVGATPPAPQGGEVGIEKRVGAPPATPESASRTLHESGCDPARQRHALRDGLDESLPLPDALCYRLELSIGEEARSFAGRAIIRLRNVSPDPWPDLLFRLYPASPLIFGGEVVIEDLQLDGTPRLAKRELPDRTGLRVPLERPLGPGESATVDIRFSGSIPGPPNRLERRYGIFARTSDALTMVSWFPLLAVWDEEADGWAADPVDPQGDAVFSEIALIEATVSAPDRYSLAASGVALDERREGGRLEVDLVTGPARDLALVWMEGYEPLSREVDGTRIDYWRPADVAGARNDPLVLEAAAGSLELFTDAFGAYPFETLDIVAVPLALAAGVEYPQLFLLDSGLISGSSAGATRFVTAHEMAHQWWYYVVGNDVFEDPWLDEALTNWSALYWLAIADGEQVADSIADQYAGEVARLERGGTPPAISDPLSRFNPNRGDYATIVYLKGALFFETLRDEIGEEALLAALQSYYTDLAFGIATPADLLDRIERAAGRDLDPLYEEWGVLRAP